MRKAGTTQFLLLFLCAPQDKRMFMPEAVFHLYKAEGIMVYLIVTNLYGKVGYMLVICGGHNEEKKWQTGLSAC